MRSWRKITGAVWISPLVLAQDALPTAVLAAPEPNPPALARSIPPAADRGTALPAAGPVAWVIGELTDEEQKLLELINRARAHPEAEAARLQALSEVDVRAAYVGFGVDFPSFAADMALRPVAPPLTPQAQLMQAARGHSQYQFDNAVQSHDELNFATGVKLNGIAERADAVGYLWTSLRESVFSYAFNMEYAHAGFEVDWGNGPGGQQSPPGHRNNNHDPQITEVGVGVVVGNHTVVRPDSTNSVGPRVVTIDFGRPITVQRFVTGVAYYDLNGDGEYDEGEGLPGVRVDVGGANFFGTTTRAGGYGVPVADGVRTVTFSGPGLNSVTRSVTVDGTSVKADLALAYAAPLLNGSATPTVGAVNLYQPAAFPSVTAYEWRASRRLAFETVLGAENGIDGFTGSTTGTYVPRSTATHATGLASYRLLNANATAQTLTQDAELVAQSNANVRFNWRLGFSTESSVAAVEISTDGGGTWNVLWSHAGLGAGVVPGASYQAETVPLNLAAGTAFRLRFRYSVTSGLPFYNSENDARVGFFFDDVAYTGTDVLLPAGSGEVTAGSPVPFTPAVAGEYVLQIRPKIGDRVFPFREGTVVVAKVGQAVTAVTRITGAAIGPNGKMKVDFSVLSGTAAGFDLEKSAVLGGVWTRDAAAVLSTNSPGQLTFRTTPSGNVGFLRIRAK